MQPKLVDVAHDRVIVGLASRIVPERAGTDIPAAWQRFMQADFKSRVTPANPDMFAAYCDYEADSSRAYTMVLGCEVDASSKTPVGLRRVSIPYGREARFLTEGNPAEVIWKAWTFINESWDGRAARRYIADYERYDASFMSPTQARAEVVVGVRPA